MENQKTPKEGNEGNSEDLSEDSGEFGALLEAYADAENREDIAEQEAAMMKVWQYIAETEDDEPCPWLEATGEAHQYEAAFDWVAAEAAYKRAIEVTADQPGLQSSAYDKLSALYSLLGSDALALEAAQAATQVARRDSISSILSIRLQAEAKLHLKAKNFEHAWATINEAFAVIEAGPLHNLERAYAWTLRADYFVEQGDFSAAETALASAWPLLEPHSETFFAAGWQSGLANWWATTANLRTQENDLLTAVSAWREVVTRRRIIAQLPQLEGPYKHNALAVALRNLGRAQRQAGDKLATQSFKESGSIRRAIGLPPLEE